MLRPPSLPHARAARSRGLVTLFVTVLAALVGPVAPGAAGRADAASGQRIVPTAAATRTAEQQQPLVPRIRVISPDYVPEHGPIVVRGVVTNASDRTWSAINVHAFMGDSPLTSATDLATAAELPVAAFVGSRITVPGTFASIPSLAPGQPASFRLRLPHAVLPLAGAGVYWFGVHVLGDNGEGDPRVAVGRDRTFLTYVPHTAADPGVREDAALVAPVRAGVVRGPDGAVVDPDVWGRSLRSGPLHALLTLGRATEGRPLTYLLDPAVPDVVRQLARGNPPRSLGPPTRRSGDQPSEGPSSNSTADPTTHSTTDGASGGASGTTPDAATRNAARSWLRQLRQQLGSPASEVLGLPYGDLDVESAVRTGEGSSLLDQALRRSKRFLRGWGLPASLAVAPPPGRTTAFAMQALPRATDVLLDDTGVSADGSSGSTVVRAAGHRVVLGSAAAASGGPGPVSARSSLALRQRILAEAALRLLDHHQPLVVQLPDSLSRRLGPSFFAGLDVPWLHLTTLGGATSLVPTPHRSVRLRTPAPRPHLVDRLYGTAGSLLADGRTLQSVLPGNHVLLRQLFDEVSGNASYTAAREPYLAVSRTRIIKEWVGDPLGSIDLAAPPSVTLAGTSGRFSALVSNQLDVEVRVTVRASSDDRLKISGGENVRLPPHGQATVSLSASTHQRGVHNVTLRLTSLDGRVLPHASDSFPMRSEQFSGLIWVIIGVGVGLLFAAIAVRLTRRIMRERTRRRTARAG